MEQVGTLFQDLPIFNLDDDSLVLHDILIISSYSIIELCQPPTNILEIINGNRLQVINHQVCLHYLRVL